MPIERHRLHIYSWYLNFYFPVTFVDDITRQILWRSVVHGMYATTLRHTDNLMQSLDITQKATLLACEAR